MTDGLLIASMDEVIGQEHEKIVRRKQSREGLLGRHRFFLRHLSGGLHAVNRDMGQLALLFVLAGGLAQLFGRACHI